MKRGSRKHSAQTRVVAAVRKRLERKAKTKEKKKEAERKLIEELLASWWPDFVSRA